MVTRKSAGSSTSARQNTMGVDRVKLRLALFAVLLIAAFAALYSRLWFLQVLAADEYSALAKENRVRKVQSEPSRGRILDRNGDVLVDNRLSLAVTVDRLAFSEKRLERTLRRLARLLETDKKELKKNLNDNTVSPYKPVPVAKDIPEMVANYITEHQDDLRGVAVENVPVREYPQGRVAAQVLGYVGEIDQEELDSDFVEGARPRYQPGDLVGKGGLERTYDRYLRGRPKVVKVVVNSVGEIVGRVPIQDEQPGRDVITSLDADIQKLSEDALTSGINAARTRYVAPAGAVVVMDPSSGHVLAIANHPTYDPALLADGISDKEWASLGNGTETPDDDAFLNRGIQAQRQPGSTFKVVTAGAAMALGVLDPYGGRDCPGSVVYPPDAPPGATIFNNWTSADNGYVGVAKSLEISCNTFYYRLGWEMENLYGAPESAGGNGTERFQKYERLAGFGDPTGIDLAFEQDGTVPDKAWCKANEDIGYCPDGWLPGYTINMAIGQGDLTVTPIQMAVTYSAIANDGTVWEPRIGVALGRENVVSTESSPTPTATEAPEVDDEDTAVISSDEIRKEFKTKAAARLPLDAAEIDVIQEGLEDVISGASGTAAGAFAGFPLDRFPLAGKTGTAELADTGLQDAWFVSYGPTTDPRYVVAVYVEKAGHGGETAAPIARQVWEGIASMEGIKGLDVGTDVTLSQDLSD